MAGDVNRVPIGFRWGVKRIQGIRSAMKRKKMMSAGNVEGTSSGSFGMN